MKKFLREHKKLTLKNIRIIILPIIIPTMMLGILASFVIESEISTRIYDNTVQITDQVRREVEHIFQAPNSVASYFDVNAKYMQDLKKLLAKEIATPYSSAEYDDEEAIKNIIKTAQYNNHYIHSIYVYLQNDLNNFFTDVGLVEGNNYVKEAAWEEQYVQMQPSDVFLVGQRTILDGLYGAEGVHCISVMRQVQDNDVSNEKNAVVVVNYRSELVEQYLKEGVSFEGGAMILVDGNDSVLSSSYRDENRFAVASKENGGQVSVQDVFDSEKFVSIESHSKEFGIGVVYLIPNEVYYRDVTVLHVMVVLFIFVALAIGIRLSFVMAKRNIRSLELVVSTINAAESGHVLEIPENTLEDQYDYILQNVLTMYVQRNLLKDQINEDKYTMKTMEMKLLQAQINPHFLYNTLKTIFWKSIALTQGQNNVSNMIEDLSEIMLYVFNVPGTQVTLAQEVKYAQNYINLQKVRYDNGFSVIWDYDEQLENASVLKLMFQPILENALMHGYSGKLGRKFRLKISLYKRGDNIVTTITDNGIGMSKETLQVVQARIDSKEEANCHIGLANVKKRLFLMYSNAELEFKIRSKENLGTSISIVFPYLDR